MVLFFVSFQANQTPLSLAQQLGYISLVEKLKPVTSESIISNTDEKITLLSPESMRDSVLYDSDEETGKVLLFGILNIKNI